MFIDLEREIVVKTKIAKMFGLNTAVYWSALMILLQEIIDTKQYDKKTGFFSVDRDRIENITTLTQEQQRECDKLLKSQMILCADKKNKDSIFLDLKTMSELIVSDNAKTTEIAKAVKSSSKGAKKEAKKEGQLEAMKKMVFVEGEDEKLQEAMYNWAESVYNKYGIQTKLTVSTFVSEMESAFPDKKTRTEAYLFAGARQLNVFQWVINSFSSKSYKNTQNSYYNRQISNISQNSQVICTELEDD